MQLFSCKVRLSGSLYNEVQKIGVTVPEIYVLRQVHGFTDNDDGGSVDPSVVVDIKPMGEVQRLDSEERARLAGIYNKALKRQGKSVDLLFGVGQPLPVIAEGIGAGPTVQIEPGAKVKRKYTRRAPGPGAEAGGEEADALAELAG